MARRATIPTAVLALLLAACGGSPESIEPTAVGPVATLPGLDLGVEDEIESIDLAADDGGALHLIWREKLAEPLNGRRSRTRHAWHDSTGSWHPPREVTATGETPRIVFGQGALHLVAGANLAHLVYSAERDQWQQRQPLLGDTHRALS